MRLIKIGPNAHALETPGGALLFSYEQLAAVRQGSWTYVLNGRPLSTATRAHLARFCAVPHHWSVTPAPEFAGRCRQVLAAAP